MENLPIFVVAAAKPASNQPTPRARVTARSGIAAVVSPL